MPGRSWSAASAEGYRFGFNGKEGDSEIKGEYNSYDFGARVYDSRLGKFLTIDPKSKDYSWQSSYAYFLNSPVAQIDFNGEGDYYSKDGRNLGSDGKKVNAGTKENPKMVGDDKAYVTKQSVIDKFTVDGKTDWDKVIANSDTRDLGISNSTLGKFSNAIKRESSGNTNESYAIASAIKNLSIYKEKDLLKTLQTEGIYGYDGNTSFTNEKFQMAAAINALQGGIDYSNGAIRWDGFDLAGRGFDHIKATSYGFVISSEHFNTFKTFWNESDKLYNYSGKQFKSFSNNFYPTMLPASSGLNKGRVLLQSSAAHGGTIFWKAGNNDVIIWKQFPTNVVDFETGYDSYPTYPNKGYKFDLKRL